GALPSAQGAPGRALTGMPPGQSPGQISLRGADMPTETLYPPEPTVACGRCREDVHGANTRLSAEGDRICSGCQARVKRCDCCGLPRSREGVHTDGGRVCQWCRRSYFYECDDCATLISAGSYCTECAGTDDRDDADGVDCSCDVCRTELHESSILSYDYRPEPEFFGDGPLYMGLELEISTPYDGTQDCADIATRHLKDLGYLKHDGSLTRGFEIVTHPMSHDFVRESFPWPMLDALRQHGAAPDHTTGLHVHVSRAAFASAAHVYRWLKFLHRNNEPVSSIARRRSDQWAAWSSEDRRRAKDYAKGDRESDRYRAINVTNPDTFEVRVFASTLDRRELQAAVDLVAASVEYTCDLSVADIYAHCGWRWCAFATWVTVRPEYAALAHACSRFVDRLLPEEQPCAC
ncbi:MAG: amidoligase family protein, partial [Pseudonocardia sp.]